MRIVVREADLNAERAMLIEAFSRYLTPLSDNHRYDWLYLENPDGCAQIWVAHDAEGDQVIGSGTAIPRRLYVGGIEKLGCIFADFWIHPQYRSLGPALKLQRACMESMASGRFALFYDFPKSA